MGGVPKKIANGCSGLIFRKRRSWTGGWGMELGKVFLTSGINSLILITKTQKMGINYKRFEHHPKEEQKQPGSDR